MPQIPAGNLRNLIAELHALHRRAGLPGVRAVAKETDFSHTAVHDLFTAAHRQPPNIQLVHAVAAVLASMARGVDVDETADWMDKAWRDAVEMPFDPNPAVKSSEPTDGNESVSTPFNAIPTAQELRRASKGAQPFVVDRFVTTVFMQGKSAVRRITERVVTAQDDGVESYTAKTFSGRATLGRDYVPVQALWGCQAETVQPSRPGDPIITLLKFPQALQRGEQAHFASEASFEPDPQEYDRDWIDVIVDHHGIVPASSCFAGSFPLSGLTIRVRFDTSYLPAIAWWYAEVTEEERTRIPKRSEGRLLDIDAGEVSYTFTGLVCQPRESYGIGWEWPARR
jgi:hypothetical protein